MQTKKWNEVRAGSRIHLAQAITYSGFEGKQTTLAKGTYYIVGFWANACGLSADRKDIHRQTSQQFIPSFLLTKFDGIKK